MKYGVDLAKKDSSAYTITGGNGNTLTIKFPK